MLDSMSRVGGMGLRIEGSGEDKDEEVLRIISYPLNSLFFFSKSLSL